ncbi:ribosomal L1 [Micractinium conductrix]|uniref:Ribosomal L1 n=1 Tax=Micractinium conductrix TaxID=554055 RepID=A0A2P6V0A7_9CHLO|nr:ribosomal L1 [Micractinium conductrix]|eukprot:PSC67503.1 ribosomal L1 [Micractinium conductrix]
MAKSVNVEQVGKAVAALQKWLGTKEDQLLEEDELMYLVIALKKIPQRPRNDKPIRIPIPHPIHSTDNAEVCLFVKDHKGEGHKAAKSKVREERVAGISKVVGLSKLKTKYESHEAKRQLCNSYDLFAADERILPSLPKLLGKAFFKKKKQPVPVRLTGKDWAAQIRKACEATYLFWSGGNSLTIKVARSSQDQQQCVDNTLSAIAAAVEKVPRKWEGVQALFLKTSDSVALPIYQHDTVG